MATEPWKDLLDYWRSKHTDGKPPGRKHVDPAVDIPGLFANLLIADLVPEGYRYQIVGSAVAARHGEDMTGRLAGTSQSLQPVRGELIDNYDAVRIGQRPRILTSGRAGDGRSEAITVILPLVAPSGGTEALLIGVFYEKRGEPVGRIDFLTPNGELQ